MEHRVSNSQLEYLLSYLGEHTSLVKGIGLGPRSKEAIDRQWTDLAQILNSHGSGATKTGQRWKRYWHDLKHKVKSRAAARRRDACGTGGGPPTDNLSENDKKVLAIISEEAVFGDTQHRVPLFEAENVSVNTAEHIIPESTSLSDVVVSNPGTSEQQIKSPVQYAILYSPSTSGQTNIRGLSQNIQEINESTSFSELVISGPSTSTQQLKSNVQSAVLHSPSTSGQTNIRRLSQNIQEITDSPRSRPRRKLIRSTPKSRRNTKTTDRTLDAKSILELETRRVEAEEKLANAAIIIAESMRTQSDSWRVYAEALQAHTATLNKIILNSTKNN